MGVGRRIQAIGIMSRNPWAEDQLEILRQRYANERTEAIARDLGRSLVATYSAAYKLGLKKSPEWSSSTASGRLFGNKGHDHRFKKGLVPWNKGIKGLDMGFSSTRFKPGQLSGQASLNYQPIGTERISKDGYLQRKINDNMPAQRRWRGVHILLWEENNGPLPKGHAIVFKNGNKQEITLDNLECVTRAEPMRRNSFHQYGKDIAHLVQLRGAITRQINKRERKSK